MASLHSLALASNNLSGDVPDLSALKNLQVVDLANNSLGPAFPRMGRRVASVVLSGNRFSDALPGELGSFYLLEHLDVSRNHFVGPFPPTLLALPSMEYLSVAGNRFTGLLAGNMSCGGNLRFVDLSSNLLTGSLPTCLTGAGKNNDESKVVVSAAANCLSAAGDTTQHPSTFCQNQALAVGIVPDQARGKKKRGARAAVLAGIVAGAIAGAVLVGVAVFLAVRKVAVRRAKARPPRRLVEHASSAYPSQFFADARTISLPLPLFVSAFCFSEIVGLISASVTVVSPC
jgi:hypothetical protein